MRFNASTTGKRRVTITHPEATTGQPRARPSSRPANPRWPAPAACNSGRRRSSHSQAGDRSPYGGHCTGRSTGCRRSQRQDLEHGVLHRPADHGGPPWRRRPRESRTRPAGCAPATPPATPPTAATGARQRLRRSRRNTSQTPRLRHRHRFPPPQPQHRKPARRGRHPARRLPQPAHPATAAPTAATGLDVDTAVATTMTDRTHPPPAISLRGLPARTRRPWWVLHDTRRTRDWSQRRWLPGAGRGIREAHPETAPTSWANRCGAGGRARAHAGAAGRHLQAAQLLQPRPVPLHRRTPHGRRHTSGVWWSSNGGRSPRLPAPGAHRRFRGTSSSGPRNA
jgi:hypothetical protein